MEEEVKYKIGKIFLIDEAGGWIVEAYYTIFSNVCMLKISHNKKKNFF